MTKLFPRSTDGFGAVWAQPGDTTTQLAALEALGNAVVVPPGAYTIATALTSTDDESAFFVMPGATFSGAQEETLFDGTLLTFNMSRENLGGVLHLNYADPNYPEATERSFRLNLTGNYDTFYTNKYLSGATSSLVSDGRFNAFFIQTFNDMTRPTGDSRYGLQGGALQLRHFYGLNAAASGSTNVITSQVFVYDGANPSTFSGEVEAGHFATIAAQTESNAGIKYWSVESNVVLPTTGQEGMGNAYFAGILKLNSTDTDTVSSDGLSDRLGAGGYVAVTVPGLPALGNMPGNAWAAATTSYKLRYGFWAGGFTGRYDTANDGTHASATAAFGAAFWAGGNQGPIYYIDPSGVTRQRFRSKIEYGFRSEDFTLAGFYALNPHPDGAALPAYLTVGSPLAFLAQSANPRVRLENTSAVQNAGAALLLLNPSALSTQGGALVGATVANAGATQGNFLIQQVSNAAAFVQNLAIMDFQTQAWDFYTNAVSRLQLDGSGNVRVGVGSLAQAATDGFLYIPTIANAPSGTPTAKSGFVPIAYDLTNNKLVVYEAAWLATGALT